MTRKQLGQQLNAILKAIEATAKVNLWKAVNETLTAEDVKKLDALHAKKNAILNAIEKF